MGEEGGRRGCSYAGGVCVCGEREGGRERERREVRAVIVVVERKRSVSLFFRALWMWMYMRVCAYVCLCAYVCVLLHVCLCVAKDESFTRRNETEGATANS